MLTIQNEGVVTGQSYARQSSCARLPCECSKNLWDLRLLNDSAGMTKRSHRCVRKRTDFRMPDAPRGSMSEMAIFRQLSTVRVAATRGLNDLIAYWGHPRRCSDTSELPCHRTKAFFRRCCSLA